MEQQSLGDSTSVYSTVNSSLSHNLFTGGGLALMLKAAD
jgi:hypothetical protein